MINKEHGSKYSKKQYKKPQLEQVQLVFEEAVLQTCKTGNATGPGGKSCIVISGGPCLKSQPS